MNSPRFKALMVIAVVIVFFGMLLLLPTLIFSYLLYLLFSILGLGFTWSQCFAGVMIFTIFKTFRSRRSISAKFRSNIHFGQRGPFHHAKSRNPSSIHSPDDEDGQIIDVEAKVID